MSRISFFASALSAAVLLNGVVLAQSKDDARKEESKDAQSAPKQSQSGADKKERQKEEPAKEAKKTESTKPSERKDSEQSSDARQDRNQSERQPARDTEKNRSDADRPRTQPGEERNDRPRDADNTRSRDADNTRRDSRDTERSDRARAPGDSRPRDGKQHSAADLGFSFSEERSDDGLKISKVHAKGIASNAKFRDGDVVVSVNGRAIRSENDFIRWVHTDTRERIAVIVMRDEREVTLYLEPDVLIQDTAVGGRGGAWLGVDLVDRFRDQAVVLKVHPNSPAERAGLRSDDLILTVEGQDIKSPEHLGQVIGQMAPGTEVEIQVDRNRRTRVVDAVLGQRDNVAQRNDVNRPSTPPPPPPTFREQTPRQDNRDQRDNRGLLPSLLPRR